LLNFSRRNGPGLTVSYVLRFDALKLLCHILFLCLIWAVDATAAQPPNPHQKLSCTECHLNTPDGEISVQIKRDCKSCHPEHIHLSPIDRSYKKCHECHEPHGTKETIYYLSRKFVLAQPSETNPHKDDKSCTRCHTKRPEKGQPVDLLYNGKLDVLCTSCHWSQNFMHPIEVTIPSRLQMPKSLPLSAEKKITCQTCHDSCTKHQVKEPGLIRQTPGYKSHNDMCFECHKRKRYTKINPHNEQQNTEKCLYCHDHDVRLSYETSSRKKVLRTNEFVLCLRCHTERNIPNFSTHKLHKKITPGRLVMPSALPLDTEGMLTCSTCHNPHFWEGNKLPLRGDLPLNRFCMNCHPDL
jgi:predicted CXXCH cytochrome family protein